MRHSSGRVSVDKGNIRKPIKLNNKQKGPPCLLWPVLHEAGSQTRHGAALRFLSLCFKVVFLVRKIVSAPFISLIVQETNLLYVSEEMHTLCLKAKYHR